MKLPLTWPNSSNSSLGQAGAVHGDERRVAPHRLAVDESRDDILADAAFAGDQDLAGTLRGPAAQARTVFTV